MGFGILFTGLLSMTAAVSPLSESETFANMFYQLSGKPVLGFLLGAGVAFLLQSSSATIGILQAIATTGALTFSSVYAIIIGVNIGDCVTTAIVIPSSARERIRSSTSPTISGSRSISSSTSPVRSS